MFDEFEDDEDLEMIEEQLPSEEDEDELEEGRREGGRRRTLAEVCRRASQTYQLPNIRVPSVPNFTDFILFYH